MQDYDEPMDDQIFTSINRRQIEASSEEIFNCVEDAKLDKVGGIHRVYKKSLYASEELKAVARVKYPFRVLYIYACVKATSHTSCTGKTKLKYV